MTLTFSEYLMRDFVVEHVDAMLVKFGAAGRVRFPEISSGCYFHLTLSGTTRLQLEQVGQSVELQAGDFALLLYGAGHRLGHGRDTGPDHLCEGWQTAEEPPILTLGQSDDQACVLSGYLQLTRALRNAPVNRALPHLIRSHPYRQPDHSKTETARALSRIESACHGPGASAFIFSLAQLHMVQTLRQVRDDMQQVLPVHIYAPEVGRVTTLVRKIRAHPERHWTVAALAEEIGWSRSTFAAKFQTYAGMGPIKFVAKTRLTHAASMLKGNPELPLWEVAKRTGYDAQGSFTRAFKTHFGVSPRIYAAQFKEQTSKEPVIDSIF